MKNWDDLRYFLSISRHGSLAGAARALSVDQSTVFRRLRALESYLGTQLFDRRQHGKYELTAAGESLHQQASRIESATFNIEREVQGQDLQLSGKIRVTTAEDIAVVLLPELLCGFQQAYPAISVELLTANRYFSLSRGEADVAIRPGSPGDEARVIPRKISRIYFGLFASPNYLQQSSTPKHQAELRKHRLIGWAAELNADGFAGFLDDYYDPDGFYGSNSLMAQRAMAENGMGIAFLPEFVGALSDRLVRVLPKLRLDSGHIWILHHDDLRHAARVRAFVEYMQDALRKVPVLNSA